MAGDSPSPLRRTAWILVLLMEGLLLTAGCKASAKAPPSPGKDIVIFVDTSASIRDQDKALFEQDIHKRIIPSLSPADRIRLAPINDRTLADFRPLLEVAFPPKREFTGWLDNVLEYNRKAKEADAHVAQLRESVAEEVRAIFKQKFSSQQTDVFSSLLIAQKLFRNESRRKVLVLMSDMIEDYPPYHFERIDWSPATTENLLAELDAKGLIPNLSGVCVYVSGISAASAELAGKIELFWKAYFQRTKADMDPSRYAHVLLHWPPSESCGHPKASGGPPAGARAS